MSLCYVPCAQALIIYSTSLDIYINPEIILDVDHDHGYVKDASIETTAVSKNVICIKTPELLWIEWKIVETPSVYEGVIFLGKLCRGFLMPKTS